MSKKVVFLGCENYHARQFLTYIKEDKKYKDIEVMGCHSLLDKPAQDKLAEDFNIKTLDNYNDCVGKVDAVIVTARNGDYHLEFAKDYLKDGITAFIDKPITTKEKDAIELAKIAKENNIKLTGQSSLMFDPFIMKLKKIKEESGCLGGFVRAPISMNNPHGGFFFYCEHLVDMVLYVFGWYPKAVLAKEYENEIMVTFFYDDFEVQGMFGKDNYKYGAGIYTKEGTISEEITILGGEQCFKDHFDELYEVMNSKENKTDYKQFIAPVFVYNAIYKSMKNNKVVKVRKYDI